MKLKIILFTIVVIIGLILIKEKMALAQKEQQKMDSLEEQVEFMRTEIEELKRMSGKIQYPPNLETRKAVEKSSDFFLKDKIFDLVWKKLFHFITFFESADGWSAGGTGSNTLTGSTIALASGAVSANEYTFRKTPSQQGLITFSQKSAIRSSFKIDSVANVTHFYLVTGSLSGSNSYYGFKLVDGNLYGVSSRAGTASEQTVLLQAISAATTYHIEARFSPNEKITFFVNATEKGTINDTSKLPKGVDTTELVNTSFINMAIKTGENSAKTVELSFIEYLQLRNKLQ